MLFRSVVLLGIAAEKALLYAGHPTSITESRNDEALRAQAEALIAALLPEFAGDRLAALNAMRESAPTLSAYIN